MGAVPSSVQLSSCTRVDRSYSDERAYGLHGCKGVGRKKNWPQNLKWLVEGANHHTVEEIDVGVLMDKESLQARAAHQIRESFREKAWDLFFSTTRRHAADLEATPVYNERRVKLIRTAAARSGTQYDKWRPFASFPGHGDSKTKQQATEHQDASHHMSGVCWNHVFWQCSVVKKCHGSGAPQEPYRPAAANVRMASRGRDRGLQ